MVKSLNKLLKEQREAEKRYEKKQKEIERGLELIAKDIGVEFIKDFEIDNKTKYKRFKKRIEKHLDVFGVSNLNELSEKEPQQDTTSQTDFYENKTSETQQRTYNHTHQINDDLNKN